MPAKDPNTGLRIFGPVNESSNAVYETEIQDQNSNKVTTLDYLKLTLIDVDTGNIINSRDGVSIVNDNGGIFPDSNGKLSLKFSNSDNVIVDQRKSSEDHLARLDFSIGESFSGSHAIIVRVRNLQRLGEC